MSMGAAAMTRRLAASRCLLRDRYDWLAGDARFTPVGLGKRRARAAAPTLEIFQDAPSITEMAARGGANTPKRKPFSEISSNTPQRSGRRTGKPAAKQQPAETEPETSSPAKAPSVKCQLAHRAEHTGLADGTMETRADSSAKKRKHSDLYAPVAQRATLHQTLSRTLDFPALHNRILNLAKQCNFDTSSINFTPGM